jgi:hypothetical protein
MLQADRLSHDDLPTTSSIIQSSLVRSSIVYRSIRDGKDRIMRVLRGGDNSPPVGKTEVSIGQVSSLHTWSDGALPFMNVIKLMIDMPCSHLYLDILITTSTGIQLNECRYYYDGQGLWRYRCYNYVLHIRV